MYARGIVRRGSRASSAAIAAPSIARKNQIANGMAAKIPPTDASDGASAPDQPCAAKLDHAKPPLTTPMNTSSSTIASTVTTSSKVAAIVTPAMFRAMNTT